VTAEESANPSLVELVHAQMEAANRHDLDGFMGGFAADGVYDASADGLGVYEGRAAARGLIADWWGMFDELHFEVEEALELGADVGFVVLRHEGRPTGSSARVETRQAYVFELSSGMTERITVYGDIDAGRAAAERLAASRR
jgi:hypothetical protein